MTRAPEPPSAHDRTSHPISADPGEQRKPRRPMEGTMKPTSDWRSVIKVHPAADLFPMMSPDELATLTEDIRANGLKNLIATWFDENEEEWLIDGRNRLDAMGALGYLFNRGLLEREAPQLFISEPGRRGNLPVQHYSDVDPYTLAISFNINRRHLTTAQKSEVIAALLNAKPGRSDSATAKLAKVSDKTVGKKRKELEATSEIPKLDKRVGADGKTRSAPKKIVVEAAVWTDAELAAIGINKHLAKAAREAAALSEAEFEQKVQEAREAVRAATVPPTDIWDGILHTKEGLEVLQAVWKEVRVDVRKEFLVWVHNQHYKMFHATCKIADKIAKERIAAATTSINRGELDRAEEGRAAA